MDERSSDKKKIKKHFSSWLIAGFDLVCMTFSFFLALFFGNLYAFNAQVFIDGAKAYPILLSISIVIFLGFDIFHRLWQYAGAKDYLRLAAAVSVSVFIFAVIDSVFLKWIFDISVYFMIWATTMVVLCLWRGIYAVVFIERGKSSQKNRKRTMIVGAGYTANTILGELLRDASDFYPVCLIDDDMHKIGKKLHGVKVAGNTAEIPQLAKRYAVDSILFAIPSANAEQRKKILNRCMQTGAEIKVLPFMSEMVGNSDMLSQAYEMKIEDLLGRKPVLLEDTQISSCIQDKICVVTGGGGSIGSELCRQIARLSPKKLIILDINENGAYEIEQELKDRYQEKLNLHVEIASVTDSGRMRTFFAQTKPDILFHAAAHKHVPLMEGNPEEAVLNNVFGTYQIAQLADAFGLDKFILISTDKAVNPTSVMGATKRCCEMVVGHLAQISEYTEFAAVRFGNVLFSNGSALPLFKKQIEKGGPVKITHKEMTRYFMSIPEAVNLVLQAAASAQGGEIFVLDMGQPVKILSIVENLIEKMGYRPYEQIPIEFTGLRPGEKLYEELLLAEEGLQKTAHDKIFVGVQSPVDADVFLPRLNALFAAARQNDRKKTLELLHQIVPTFQSPK